MLDRQLIRNQPEAVRAGAARKGIAAPVDELTALVAQRNELLVDLQAKQAEMNKASKSIGMLMGQGKREEAEQAKAQTKELKDAIAEGEANERELDAAVRALELQIPNIPHDSVPEGRDETQNRLVREWGEKPQIDEPKPHWDVATELRMIDFERGPKISGSGFALYTGPGARLQRALFSFMIDLQTSRHGYLEIYPPYIVNAASLLGTAQLPKFEEDLYKVDEDRYLVPTAEVPVTNMYRDEILDGELLTIKLAAFSGCFRKEAGAAGKDTRGIQRMHQFDKVELVKFAKPEDSYEELESLTKDAEVVLQELGLHYRVMEMCEGELSFSNAKQYDLEVWSPGMEKYLEISSCSNFEAFQARRANIKFRRAAGEKPEFVHTLNGSGLATPRLFAVILESFRQPDGSLTIPEPLRPYMGVDRVAPDR
jgi:seryl-tRNA synthetase